MSPFLPCFLLINSIVIYLPAQIRFPIGGKRVTCSESKLTKAPAKRLQHFNATYPATLFGHPVAKCCDMLDVDGKFFMHHLRMLHNIVVFWPGSSNNMLHCGMRSSSIFNTQHVGNTLQHGGQTLATCCAQQCCDIFCWNVAIVKHFNATYRNIGKRNMLRASGHHIATRCNVLRHVGCCWLKFENCQIFDATSVDVAWCCNRLARFVQPCCAWACALIWFSSRNMQHVATGWPNARNMLRPTMLRYVVSKCCDRLAVANSVGMCCADMLQSF